MEEKVKHYEKEDLTVVWKPSKCIHAEECVKALPQVYNPNERPWIKVENATSEELRAQIKLCPSGALSFMEKNKEDKTESVQVQANVLPDGPIVLEGKINLKFNNESKIQEKVALCRCGASSNKPFCDGTHSKIDFKG